MNVRVLETDSKFRVICNSQPDNEIKTGYTSDLLSDVLANADEESALITIQAHKNSVAVATITGTTAIIICNDRPIPDDMIAAADESGVALFLTSMNQFETSIHLGKLLEVHG